MLLPSGDEVDQVQQLADFLMAPKVFAFDEHRVFGLPVEVLTILLDLLVPGLLSGFKLLLDSLCRGQQESVALSQFLKVLISVLLVLQG